MEFHLLFAIRFCHKSSPPQQGNRFQSTLHNPFLAIYFFFPGISPPQSSFRKPLFSRFSAKLFSKSSAGLRFTAVPFSRATSTVSATALAGIVRRRFTRSLVNAL